MLYWRKKEEVFIEKTATKSFVNQWHSQILQWKKQTHILELNENIKHNYIIDSNKYITCSRNWPSPPCT